MAARVGSVFCKSLNVHLRPPVWVAWLEAEQVLLFLFTAIVSDPSHNFLKVDIGGR